MRTNNIPISDGNKAPFLEIADSPPERSFTTPWLLGNGGLFRVNLTIIGPVSEELKDDVPPSWSKAEGILETISNEVKLLEEKLL